MLPMYQERVSYHEARARMWRERGMEDYAKGSDRKADRWRARGEEFERVLDQPPLSEVMKLMDERAKLVTLRLVGEFERALLGDAHD
jgi:hypothetical protein